MASRAIKLVYERAKTAAFRSPRARDFALQAVYQGEFAEWCDESPCRMFPNKKRFDMFDYVFELEGLDAPLDYLEFGVYKGTSLKWWVERNVDPESRFVGFDTFTGLPEDWIPGLDQGAYSRDGQLPAIDDPRVLFERGLFQDTLPNFLRSRTFDRRLVIHIDADLYSSTLYALIQLAHFLKPRDIILFDEFGFHLHEFRAFRDAITAFPLRFEAIARTGAYYRVAVKVVE